jgi:hypothetical protein
MHQNYTKLKLKIKFVSEIISNKNRNLHPNKPAISVLKNKNQINHTKI